MLMMATWGGCGWNERASESAKGMGERLPRDPATHHHFDNVSSPSRSPPLTPQRFTAPNNKREREREKATHLLVSSSPSLSLSLPPPSLSLSLSVLSCPHFLVLSFFIRNIYLFSFDIDIRCHKGNFISFRFPIPHTHAQNIFIHDSDNYDLY